MNDDLISRDAALDACSQSINILDAMSRIEDLPSVTPKQRKGHCKDCKYCLKKGDRAPLILPNEICSRWGGGCKTKEDGYCFLFEPQESDEISREEIAALLAKGSEEMTREEKENFMLSRKDAEMFCDHYCKFPDECDGDQEELDEICEECPLWKKCKEGES